MELKDLVAIITGAGKGLGQSFIVCTRFMKDDMGASVQIEVYRSIRIVLEEEDSWQKELEWKYLSRRRRR
jgi:hypothetical protein